MFGGNMQGMMKKVQKMQKEMKKLQDDLKKRTVEATVGGGVLTIVMNGEKNVESVDEFVDAIRDAKQNMHFCSVCFNLSSQDPCPICSDISRDRSTICVVETPQDVQAIERSGDYHGLYHVLHGALSPLDGVNVEDLRIRELLQRLGNTTVKEVILATDPDVEGEATALYLARLIKTAGIRVTRIARGLPMGGDIEYADEATLAGAVANRQEM